MDGKTPMGNDSGLRLSLADSMITTFKQAGGRQMNLSEIKAAVEAGKKVYSGNLHYEVIRDSKGQWFISCKANRHCIGLTWTDGITLNAKESSFFIGENNSSFF